MKTLLSLVLILSLFCSTVIAQPYFKNYDWEVQPNYDIEQFTNEHMTSVSENLITEFFFEEDALVEYYLEHKAYFLNSDDSIEDFNKIYLPFSSDSQLEITKARVINKDGKIINLDASKILTAKDDETERVYKYFAFEGIEKGSIIEYFYVVKQSPNYRGKLVRLQSDYLRNNLSFMIYAPKNLIFKFKSFNGLPEVVKDTLATEKNLWRLDALNIPKLELEEFVAYNADKMAISYALDENTASNTKGITSYATVAQNVYNFYNESLSKKTLSTLNKFMKDLRLDKNADLDQQIRRLENHLKTTIYVADISNDKLSDLDEILANKVASNTGVIKLYCAILNALDINFQIVFTTERNEMRFDKTFEANNFLQEVLLYFPKTDNYLSPNDNSSRYGFPPAYTTDNYGLFVKEVIVGDFKSAIAKVNYINPVPAQQTKDVIEIEVNFNPDDFSEVDITLKESLHGYYAMSLHPYMNLIPDEDKSNILKSFAQRIDENAVILSSSFENEDPNLFGVQPLIFNATLKSLDYIEKAGNKYLFKVGNLIGQQIEMYQEKERILPVENEFQREYERSITINLPDNFKIANPDDINIQYAYDVEGSNTLNFHSFYELDGNVLTITANEHYRINRIPKEDYEKYRTVINSAADFNKIVLVLEPK